MSMMSSAYQESLQGVGNPTDTGDQEVDHECVRSTESRYPSSLSSSGGPLDIQTRKVTSPPYPVRKHNSPSSSPDLTQGSGNPTSVKVVPFPKGL